jgi:tRNA pseudouridine(55) synthase
MARKKGRDLHGWLILDKPPEMTSTQALGKVKWLLQPKKAGHAGTLDPLATGVLPLALGEATKTVPFAMEGSKTYRFTIRWGVSTDTLDAEGEVTATSDVRPTRAEIEAALPAFLGDVEQIPPAYSAVKVDGERAYDLARAGEEVELESRVVRIESLRLVDGAPERSGAYESATTAPSSATVMSQPSPLEGEGVARSATDEGRRRPGGPAAKESNALYSTDAEPGSSESSARLSAGAPHPPPLRDGDLFLEGRGGASHGDAASDPDHTVLEMVCGKGAYVRALVRDLAAKLNAEGHVSALRRLRVGPFSEAQAITLAQLEDLVHKDAALERLLPVETALDDIPALAVTGEDASRLKQGRAIVLLPHQALELRERRRPRSIAGQDASRWALAMSGGQAVALGEARAGRFQPLRVFQL